MKPLIIFGNGKISDVIYYFFKYDSDREVAAFVIDDKYYKEKSCYDLPVIKSSQLERLYPPSKYDMFIALGYQGMNKLREEKYKIAQKLGYKLPSYIHPKSGIPKDCKLGDNCMIMNNVNIHPRVRIGNNVFIWSGAVVGHHSTIGDNCWITSSANISGNVNVGNNTFLAINSTIAHSVNVGKECFIGANALVSKCTKDSEVFICERTKPYRLNSEQFLKLSNFSSI